MKINKLTFFVFFGIFASSFWMDVFANSASGTPATAITSAKEHAVRVSLESIKAEKTSEKSGDEFYFDITQYSNQNRSKTARIPANPKHWLSSQTSEIKNVVLWEGVVHDQEEIKVIISLLEQDTPPWDVDDMIGSALLILENKDGKLTTRWDLPIFEDRIEQQMLPKHHSKDPQDPKDPQGFVMRGEKSQYTLMFEVENLGKTSRNAEEKK